MAPKQSEPQVAEPSDAPDARALLRRLPSGRLRRAISGTPPATNRVLSFPGCWFLVAGFVAVMLHFMVIAWTPNITRPPAGHRNPTVQQPPEVDTNKPTCGIPIRPSSTAPSGDCDALDELSTTVSAMRSGDLFAAPQLLMLQNVLHSIDRNTCPDALVRMGVRSLLTSTFIKPPDSVALAARGMQKLTFSYPLTAHLLQEDGFKYLLAVIRSNVTEARYSGLWAAANLATFAEGAKELVQEEVMRLLLGLIVSPEGVVNSDSKLASGATWVLLNLAYHLPHRRALGRSGMVERLLVLSTVEGSCALHGEEQVLSSLTPQDEVIPQLAITMSHPWCMEPFREQR